MRMSADRMTRRTAARRSSTRAATRPSRSTSCSRPGARGRAAVPSGASTGRFEAVELRDGDSSAYLGKGVLRAVANVNGEIAAALAGVDAADQRAVDETLIELDGTANKSRLGANAILGCSLAVARAAADEAGVPALALARRRGRARAAGSAHERRQRRCARAELARLPGVHGRPGRGGQRSPRRCGIGRRGLPRSQGAAARARARDRGRRRGRLRPGRRRDRGGDRGGPRGGSTAPATRTGSAIALDVAATELWHDGAYRLERRGRRRSPPSELIELCASLCERFPIVSIEDPLAEDEWEAWGELTRRLGDRVQLVGDDLFVTNVERLRRGIDEGRGQRDPRQGQPDRDADRDARRDRARPRGRLRGDHLAPLGRDRGHDDRRPRRRDRRRARSRPAPRRAATASRSTTSSCGSRRSSASVPCIPEPTRSPPDAGQLGDPAVEARDAGEVPAVGRATVDGMDGGRRRTKIVCTIGPASERPGSSDRARRGRDGRGAAQLLPRHPRGARRAVLARSARRRRGGHGRSR